MLYQPLFSLALNKKTATHIENKINNFFWNSSLDKKSIHWCSYKRLSRELPHLRDIQDWAHCLNYKLWWKYRLQRTTWAKLIHLKYAWRTHPLLAKWRITQSEIWQRLQNIKHEANQLITYKVNCGNSLLWCEDWSGLGKLDMIYTHHSSDPTTIGDLWNGISWDFSYVPDLPTSAQEILSSFQLVANVLDAPMFNLSSDSLFSVKQTWSLLHPRNHLPLDCYWHYLIPTSAYICIWKVLNGWISVDSCLQLKGFQLASRCQCGLDCESIEHLFHACPTSQKAWMFFSQKYNLD